MENREKKQRTIDLWIKANANIVNPEEAELGKNKGKSRQYWNRKQRSIQ